MKSKQDRKEEWEVKCEWKQKTENEGAPQQGGGGKKFQAERKKARDVEKRKKRGTGSGQRGTEEKKRDSEKETKR